MFFLPPTKVLNNATLDIFNWYNSQWYITCTFRYQYFFQSNTHIVSCAVRMRSCLLLTCFRFIRVLQKLIMKLELNICHLHVLKRSRFMLQCKAIFPRPLLCLSNIFSYLINYTKIKGKLRVFAVTFYTIDLTIKPSLLIPAEIENQYGLD